jgi:hypothetical protein
MSGNLTEYAMTNRMCLLLVCPCYIAKIPEVIVEVDSQPYLGLLVLSGIGTRVGIFTRSETRLILVNAKLSKLITVHRHRAVRVATLIDAIHKLDCSKILWVPNKKPKIEG